MMYRNRFLLFSVIGAVIILFLPAMTLLTRHHTQGFSIILNDPGALWAVDDTEGALAMGLWTCCGISADPDRVVIGKSGFLFLGNSYNRVLDKTTGKEMPPAETIGGWVDHLRHVSDWLAERHIDFLFVIAANKHSIYPEFLPDDIVPDTTTSTDLFVTAAQDADLPFVDTRPMLRQLKTTKQAYLKTDTHWTELGGARAYEETIRALNELGAQIKPLDFEVAERLGGGGDLANLLKVKDMLSPESELEYGLSFNETVVCGRQIPFAGELPDICQTAGNEIEDVPVFEATFAPDAPNPETALLICDSFCAANFSLYANTFQTVYQIHWNKLFEQNLADQIDRLQPDVVIFQLVERHLFDPKLQLR